MVCVRWWWFSARNLNSFGLKYGSSVIRLNLHNCFFFLFSHTHTYFELILAIDLMLLAFKSNTHNLHTWKLNNEWMNQKQPILSLKPLNTDDRVKVHNFHHHQCLSIWFFSTIFFPVVVVAFHFFFICCCCCSVSVALSLSFCHPFLVPSQQ